MKKPVIGIVVRNDIIEDQTFLVLNDEYRMAILKAGGIPLLISPTNLGDYGKTYVEDMEKLTDVEKENLYQLLSFCDGFLMPGGNHWYEMDEIVCQYAYDHDIPYFGICLGMQLLGSLDNFHQEKASDQTIRNQTNINHNQPKIPYVHKNILYPSKLQEILGKNEVSVNSRHNFHLEEKEFFVISSRSEDGLIEGIEIPHKKFMIGVQWHPESMIPYDPVMLSLFESFVQSCRKK